jgi:hypothetical protein
LYEILLGDPVFSPSESRFAVIRRIRDRDLPTLPDNHGPLMKALIANCWRQNPADRPSFGKIFEMFKAANFKIVPGAIQRRIRDFANGILAWESKLSQAT